MLCVGRNKLDEVWREREKKIHRDLAENQTRDLPITGQALLPLSHWTHSREAKATVYNSHARGLSQLQLSLSLSLSLTVIYF